MATAHHPNHRASLLNGLRTGGVRSTSMSVPNSAVSDGSFHLPRFTSQQTSFDEEDLDRVQGMFSQNLHLPDNSVFPAMGATSLAHPRLAAAPVSQRQAGRQGLNPYSPPFNPQCVRGAQPQADQDILQREILHVLQQRQRKQEMQAAALSNAFQFKQTNSIQNRPFDNPRRPSQAELLKAQLGLGGTFRDPVTATHDALFYDTRSNMSSVTFPTTPELPDHRFPSRSSPPLDEVANSSFKNPNAWRRASMMNPFQSSSPCVTVTPPAEDHSLWLAMRNPVDPRQDDATSSPSSTSSNPATPSSVPDMASLSLREEAAKKLYEGLGYGRIPTIHAPAPVKKVVSQPIRQPRGPPSVADEFDKKNFSSRMRRKAIGGLNVLMDARERRESFGLY